MLSKLKMNLQTQETKFKMYVNTETSLTWCYDERERQHGVTPALDSSGLRFGGAGVGSNKGLKQRGRAPHGQKAQMSPWHQEQLEASARLIRDY
eukprot:3656548-Amphidinium_carterae.1